MTTSTISSRASSSTSVRTSSAGVFVRHLLLHQNWYLPLLSLIILSIPLMINFVHHDPLLIGPETYYHLSQAQQGSSYSPLYYILKGLLWIHPFAPALLPPLLAIISITLFLSLARQLLEKKKEKVFRGSARLSPRSSFFVALVVLLSISSPAFIFVFSTLSSLVIWLPLVLLGMNLLLLPRYWYFSFLPLIAASFFDLYSTILLCLLLGVFLFNRLPSLRILLAIGVIMISLIIGIFIGLPFFAGPFTMENTLVDVISDLGATSGMSLFLFILALIGFACALRKKAFIPLFVLFVVLLFSYFFSTRLIFLLTFVCSAFAALALIRLLGRRWTLNILKSFTLLLLFLGLLFSLLSYLDRLSMIPPTAADQEALEWIGENTPSDAVIFSEPQNSYYITYFAKRQPLLQLHVAHPKKQNASQEILHSQYISSLFPLLQEQNVSYLYITPQMRAALPADQGFFFLLKNERFKLVHWHKGAEVWMFSQKGLVT